MRIIAGRFRRRTLKTNPGLTTRPITDRVKESLFERLGGELDGERVIDVFAGTGTIGLEALSRGANSVVFIEKDRKASELLQQNCDAFGTLEETLCWTADVFRCSFRPRDADGFFPYDLIFFDPPYPIVSQLRPGRPLYKALERLARTDVSSADARLVLRTPEKTAHEVPPIWTECWSMELSNMRIAVYGKEQFTDPEEPSQIEETSESHTETE